LERKGISVKGRDLLPKDLLDDLEKEADVKKKIKDFLNLPYFDPHHVEPNGWAGISGFSGISGYIGSSGFSGSGQAFMTPNELREMNGLGRLSPGIPGVTIRRSR
jgi:hypothetical protein